MPLVPEIFFYQKFLQLLPLECAWIDKAALTEEDHVKSVPCSLGGKNSQNTDHLKKHTCMHHHKAKNTLQSQTLSMCTYCDKLFTDTFEVQRHERRHTGEKCHMCEVCGKYILYELVSECPYAWPYWSETIQLQHPWSSLHLQVSTEKCKLIPMVMRAFNCVHCDMSFFMYIQLYNHVQLRICPFKCEGCSRVFTAYVVLTEHTQTHEKSCSGG